MGIITDIQFQKNNKNKVSIFTDNKYSFSLSYDGYCESYIKINDKISEEEIINLKRKDIQRIAYLFLIQMFSYKNYLSYEVRTKLKEKLKKYYAEELFDEELINREIEETIQKGIKNHLIDDESYLNEYIKNKFNLGWGISKIKQKLWIKGVPSEVINEYLVNIDVDFENKCLEICEKKLKSLDKITDKYKKKQKLIQYSLSKGFSYNETLLAIEKLLNY